MRAPASARDKILCHLLCNKGLSRAAQEIATFDVAEVGEEFRSPEAMSRSCFPDSELIPIIAAAAMRAG
jgi:hypothetical protein